MADPGVTQLGVHTLTDDRAMPYRTDHASEADEDRRANEPDDDHPGSSKDGTYRSENNDPGRVDVAQKEGAGPTHVGKRLGAEAETTKVAPLDGVPNARVHDGLAKKPGGTYVGIEIKSGTASRNSAQLAFDAAVSPSNPATASLNGKHIKIPGAIEEKVP